MPEGKRVEPGEASLVGETRRNERKRKKKQGVREKGEEERKRKQGSKGL